MFTLCVCGNQGASVGVGRGAPLALAGGGVIIPPVTAMRFQDNRHQHEHVIETPETSAWTPSAAAGAPVLTPATPGMLPQEAVQAYLSYGTPRWLSVDIKPGVFAEEGGGYSSQQRSLKKAAQPRQQQQQLLNGRGSASKPPSGFNKPEADDAGERMMRAMPLLDLGSASDSNEIPLVHFRECLRKASLTDAQIRALEHNQELVFCTFTLQTLSEQINEIIIALASHRKESARVLQKASCSYVLLFERMVTEFVRLSREHSDELHGVIKTLVNEITGLKSRVSDLEHQLDVCDLEQKQYSSLTAIHRATTLELKLAHQRIAELESNEAKHAKEADTWREMMRNTEKERSTMERQLRLRENQLRHELDIENAKNEVRLQELTADVTRELVTQDLKRRRLEEEAKWRASMNRRFRCRGTQTKIDHDGMWDARDGWPMTVSNRAWARIMWRLTTRFAACPACKGIKPHLTQALEQDKIKRLSTMPSEFKSSKKRGRSTAADGWFVPDGIVHFVTHLPKSAESMPIKPIAWLYCELWNLLHVKSLADEEDYVNGDPFLSLSDFVTQEYLRKAKTRMEAQLAMYDLVRALKLWRNHCPLAHLFARFFGLIDGGGAEERLDLDDDEHKSTGWEGGAQYKPLSASLDTTLLTLYLYIRRNVLTTPHSFVPPHSHRRFIPASARFHGLPYLPPWAVLTEGVSVWLPLEAVFQVVRSILYFLPTQRLKSVTAFIEKVSLIYKQGTGELQSSDGNKVVIRRAMRRATRKVNTAGGGGSQAPSTAGAMSPSSAPSHPVPPASEEGDDATVASHSTVDTTHTDQQQQQHVQQTQHDRTTTIGAGSTTQGGAGHGGGGEGGPPGEGTALAMEEGVVLVPLDHVLEYTMDVLLDRSLAMEEQIKTYFEIADTNNDGMVSFPEFSVSVNKIDPSLSPHNTSKIFREVYRDSDAFSMSRESFASVLRRFGLVRLLDLAKAQAFSSGGGGTAHAPMPPPPPQQQQQQQPPGEAATLKTRTTTIDPPQLQQRETQALHRTAIVVPRSPADASSSSSSSGGISTHSASTARLGIGAGALFGLHPGSGLLHSPLVIPASSIVQLPPQQPPSQQQQQPHHQPSPAVQAQHSMTAGGGGSRVSGVRDLKVETRVMRKVSTSPQNLIRSPNATARHRPTVNTSSTSTGPAPPLSPMPVAGSEQERRQKRAAFDFTGSEAAQEQAPPPIVITHRVETFTSGPPGRTVTTDRQRPTALPPIGARGRQQQEDDRQLQELIDETVDDEEEEGDEEGGNEAGRAGYHTRVEEETEGEDF